MMRPRHILVKVPFEEMTREEKGWYCQCRLICARGDEYKKWFDIYKSLDGGDTYDESMKWRKENSTQTTDKGVDYSPERNYRGY